MYVLPPPSPSDTGEGHLIYVALGAAAVYLVCLSVSWEEPLHGDKKQAGVWTRHGSVLTVHGSMAMVVYGRILKISVGKRSHGSVLLHYERGESAPCFYWFSSSTTCIFTTHPLPLVVLSTINKLLLFLLIPHLDLPHSPHPLPLRRESLISSLGRHLSTRVMATKQ